MNAVALMHKSRLVHTLKPLSRVPAHVLQPSTSLRYAQKPLLFRKQTQRWRSHHLCVSPSLRRVWQRQETVFRLRRQLRLIFETKVRQLLAKRQQAVAERSTALAVKATTKSSKLLTVSQDIERCSIISPAARERRKPEGKLFTVHVLDREANATSSTNANGDSVATDSKSTANDESQHFVLTKGTSFLGAFTLLQAFYATVSQNVTKAPIEAPTAPLLTLRIFTNIITTHQALRGTVDLPHSCASPTRLLVFCPNEMAPEMLSYGADYAGETDLINRITNGFLDFEKCITTPDFMPKIMRLARILGPKQMFPNPRAGTIVLNLKMAIEKIKSGASLTFRAAQDGSITAAIGRMDMPCEHIVANAVQLCSEVVRQHAVSVRTSVAKATASVKPKRNRRKTQKIPTTKISPLYFNTLDFKQLLQPPLKPYTSARKSSSETQEIQKQAPELMKSCITAGLLMAEGLPSIPVHGNGLVTTQSGFTTVWPFRDLCPNATIKNNAETQRKSSV